jgi:hypothetical protein
LESWAKDLRESVLSNFWPAIRRGIIRFTIDNQELSRNNLEAALSEFEDSEDFHAIPYYQAATSSDSLKFERTFKMIGNVSLMLLPDVDNSPKKVAFARSAGMIIQEKTFKCRRPYAGFFQCLDKLGNEFLRSMEPPKHDTLDINRLPKYSGHRQEFKKLLDWIRDSVRELNPKATEKAMDVPELAKYLPDTEDDDNMPVTPEAAGSEDSEFTPKPQDGAVTVTTTTSENPKRKIDLGAGENESDEGGDGPGSGTPDPHSGSSKLKGGLNEKGGSGGDAPQEAPDPVPGIKVRSMENGEKAYTLVVRSAEDFTGNLKVYAIGDDGRGEVIDIEKAASGEEEFQVDGGTLGDIRLTSDEPLIIKLVLREQNRLALHCELER